MNSAAYERDTAGAHRPSANRPPTDRAGFPMGKLLLSAAAVFPAVGAVVADWSPTHLSNPRWPPHAKFHTAQTITAAAELAGLGLWQLWGPGREDRSRLRWAALFGGLYWLTAAPAILFSGTAFVDPDAPVQPTTWRGVPINQVTLQAVVLFPLLAAGYALALRRLRRVAGTNPLGHTTGGRP